MVDQGSRRGLPVLAIMVPVADILISEAPQD
jgi:hypothetical protein